MRAFFSRRMLTAVAALALASGCTPAFNWREVAFGDGGQRVLLPCKPDRGERELPIGPASLHIRMVGCKAEGALFAVAEAAVPLEMKPEAVASAWRAATVAGMQALPETIASPAGARLRAQGQSGDGGVVHAQAVWLIRPLPVPHVVQAVVYSARPLPDDVADTFFSSVAPR